MRTTVTLDPDVETLIKRAMRERGLSFKAAVNEAIRRGAGFGDGQEAPALPAFDMGVPMVETLMSAPPVVAVEPTARHLSILRGLLGEEGLRGTIVNDAHLAALALEHGASVVSFDRDFERFEGLPVVRPGH